MNSARGKRIAQVLLVALFLVVIGGEFVGTVLREKQEISLEEKRRLAALPQFHWSWKSMQDYPQAFEGYWKDHFLFRRRLVALNSLLRISLFQRSPTFMTAPGSDHWYYMVGDWALQDYIGTLHMTPEGLANWEHVIDQRRKWVKRWGGHYLLVIAPNKMMVYPEHLPSRLQRHRGTTMLDALDNALENSPLRANLLDLRRPLLQAKSDRQVYFRADTHWNSYGAYRAYRVIINTLKQWYPALEPLPADRLHYTVQKGNRTDLALIMGLQGVVREEEVEAWSVMSPCAASADKPIPVPFLSNRQYPEKNGCGHGMPLRVLLISDSFGAFLRPYLSETFKEVVYDHTVEFNELERFIAAYKPDIVLHLRVARFMEKAFVADPKLDTLPVE